MLDWLVIGGLVLVGAILADDWLANRHRRPLSHMKPDPKTIKKISGMEEIDITRSNQHIAGADTRIKDRKDKNNDR